MPLFPNYLRNPIAFTRGQGSRLYDSQGNAYLDFGSGIGVTNLGHTHPKLVAALQEQAEQLWHSSNLFINTAQERVAEQLVMASELEAVFFCNSGAEANEAAFKLARKWGHEEKGIVHPEIITFARSFHGRTLATLTATGQEKVKQGFAPLPSGFVIADELTMDAIQAVANKQTVAVCLELVQGEGGVYPVPPAFAKQLAEWCKQQEILLIIDEVQTGMGRTGEWFAFQHYSLQPDVITLAKGLGNGFPVGAMLAQAKLSTHFSPGSHGTTFGGNPLAMSVSEAVCQELARSNFLPSVKKQGEYLFQQLQQVLSEVPIVQEIRGLGLMIGIELTVPAVELIAQVRQAGLIVLPAGDQVIRLLPPLIITTEEITEATEILQSVIIS